MKREQKKGRSAAGEFVAVRYGARPPAAFLDGMFPEALLLPDALRYFRLRGMPAGALFFAAPAAGEPWPVDELPAILDQLPVTTRVVAYVGPASPDVLLAVAGAADVIMLDCYTADQAMHGQPGAADGDVAAVLRLCRDVRRQVRVMPKLWIGHTDGGLGVDYARLDQLCTAGWESGIRLGLNFSQRQGPGSPGAVRKFCQEAGARFSPGKIDWGAFAISGNYGEHLAVITDELGWSRWGWDPALEYQERLAKTELLL